MDGLFSGRRDPPLVDTWDYHWVFAGNACKRRFVGIVDYHDLLGGELSVIIKKDKSSEKIKNYIFSEKTHTLL